MDAGALARVDSVVLEALADSASPGAALAVGRHGRLVRLRGYGRLDWGGGAPPATPASLWDMASVTKVAATATAAMILAEAARLDLDAPVVRYLPWWSRGDPRKEDVTVRHLLLHRGGLPPFVRFFREVEGKEAFKDAIADLPLVYAPGDSTVYSDIGLMTVAFVVEEIAGTDLDAFMRARVWDPLAMRDSRFRPDPELLDRIAPTEVDPVFRFTHVHGEVHDENAWAMGGVAGHAGLFSSARDMAVFAQTLLEGGGIGPCVVSRPPPGEGREGGSLRKAGHPAAEPGSRGPGPDPAAPPEEVVPCSGPRPGPVRIAAPTSVDLFTRRQNSTSSRALGWDTPSPGSSAGSYLTDEAFGHTGFTGTSLWVDPELDLFVVLLTSRTNPTRENRRHVPLRRAVHDAVARAITDRPVRKRTW
jgi:CubicO group peptidase (beta-lactamase class C family)